MPYLTNDITQSVPLFCITLQTQPPQNSFQDTDIMDACLLQQQTQLSQQYCICNILSGAVRFHRDFISNISFIVGLQFHHQY